MSSPQVDSRADDPAEVFLVDGLARDAEGLRDIRPAPARAQGALDRGILKAVGELAESDHGRKPIGRGIQRI
jgi:hypothetical protein